MFFKLTYMKDFNRNRYFDKYARDQDQIGGQRDPTWRHFDLKHPSQKPALFSATRDSYDPMSKHGRLSLKQKNIHKIFKILLNISLKSDTLNNLAINKH